MNKLYEMNYAGCHMVVDSLEVLGDISGKGMKQVKKSVNDLQAEQRNFKMQQEDYWSALSSDNIITPVEKKTLYKEFKEIQQTYATLRQEAIDQNLEGTTYFQNYEAAYDSLHDYLYDTLGLFNDMYSDTVISDRSAFDTEYSEYYASEKFTTLALATGIMGNLGFKVLSSLDETGTEGEIGLYRGTIYQYTSGTWLPVGLEGYMGVKEELPNGALNQYFMVGENFTVIQRLIINDTSLLVNGEELWITQEFQEGFIYYYNGETWTKVKDTSDYRYVVAMVDLVSITGQLPGVFQQAIDSATEGLIDHLPEYLGPLETFPTSAVEGDWFVYSGRTIGSHIRSDIYLWNNGDWQHIEPSDTTHSDLYMQALDDIMALNETNSATFSYVFANSFWAHSVTTDKLSTRTLYLRTGGYIQSDVTHYDPNRSGLRIDSAGNIDANGNTHIGGIATINGNTTIGGTATINGNTTIGGTTTINGNTTIGGNVDITGTGTIGEGMKIKGDIDISGEINTNKDVYIGGKCNIAGSGIIGSNMTINGDISGAGGTFKGNLQSADYDGGNKGYVLTSTGGQAVFNSIIGNSLTPRNGYYLNLGGSYVISARICSSQVNILHSMDQIVSYIPNTGTTYFFANGKINVTNQQGSTNYEIYRVCVVNSNTITIYTSDGIKTFTKSGSSWSTGSNTVISVVCIA